MATYGKVGSFNRTVGVRLDMDEAITILPVDDVPLQRWLPSRETSSVKVEWMEEGFTAQTATATSASITGSDPWVITFSDASIFRPGDVLRQSTTGNTGTTPASSLTLTYVITQVNTTANTITVAGFGGNSTAPTHSDLFEIIGQYLTEGADPNEARTTERTAKYNYTQIGQEKVEATRTARKRAMYAQEDPYDHELAKKFRELAIRFERQLALGVRSISAGTDQRAMGGLFYYITTNTASDTTANARSAVNSLLRKCWTAGGSPDTLMVSPATKVALSSIDANSRRWTMSDNIAGYTVERLATDFGEVELVVNRYFPPRQSLALERKNLSKVVFDGYHHELLAKTGDSDRGHIVGEFSLLAKNEASMGVLTITDAS